MTTRLSVLTIGFWMLFSFVVAAPYIASAQPAEPTPTKLPASTPQPSGTKSPAATQPSGPQTTTQGQESESQNMLTNPLKVKSLEELLVLILEAVVRIGSIFLTAVIIWVGFMFVAARGNEEQLSKAKRALYYAVIGGLLLLGAQAIASVIQSTVGSLRN